ncbi:MAG: helix-hairpin-helix domain-containing protein [candidate division WOR-3 bacterium]|nr:helix-hairpin-helix domain-containing protein [candidate division WOR-3 bacterium]
MIKYKKCAKRITGRFFRLLFLLFCFCSVSITYPAFTQQKQLDINKASLNEIKQLPISELAAEKIYEYILYYGGLKSIYDLRKIKEISPEKFEELKPLIYISKPKERGEEYLNLYRIQKSLATEEGTTKTAVEEWQDKLLSPININKAGVDDLIFFENVSLIDAIAVVKHLKLGREIKSQRDLRNDVAGLSNYGYRNMRNYVAFTDPKPIKFQGNYRLFLNYGYEYETNVEEKIASISQGFNEFQEPSKFYEKGITDSDIEKYYSRMEKEREYLLSLQRRTSLTQRLRTRIGQNFVGGLRWEKSFNPTRLSDEVKGFVGTYDFLPFKKIFLGDYRVTIGQGLLLDNSAELIARTYARTRGVFGDLTSNSVFSFRGAGAEIEEGNLKGLLFYSRTLRDGIENPDGTINYYIVNEPRLPTNYKNFLETNIGGSARIDLSQISFIPEGTVIGFNSLVCRYNKSFAPDVKWIDLPGDATFFDDANYTQLYYGKQRNFYSLDFRSAIENVSFEGEYAWLKNAGKAILAMSRVQYEYLYLVALARHYDVNYDNPYNRGFCEQLRFEDTPLEKPYRLIDPTFSDLQYFPTPKAEQGIYTEMRYQISRQITFTRMYFDVWRNLAYGLTNYRFQGEVEYRPVFPLRFRIKQKIQRKHLPKDVLATVSNTFETSFRVLASLEERNFLSCEVRRGLVDLTPSMEYNSEKTMWGDFLAISWEHNFSPAVNLETGIAVWSAMNLSQWIFEDVGIDFLDGRGLKYYFVVSERPTDFLMLRFKFKSKFTEFPHTALQSAKGLHFQNNTLPPVYNFVNRNDIFNVALQIDILW